MAQDYCLKLYKASKSYDCQRPVKPFFNTILARTIADQGRTVRSRREINVDFQPAAEAEQGNFPEPISSGLEPLVGLIASGAWILEHVRVEADRLVLQLMVIEEWTAAQVADVLKCTTNAVYLRKRRALEELRDSMSVGRPRVDHPGAAPER